MSGLGNEGSAARAANPPGRTRAWRLAKGGRALDEVVAGSRGGIGVAVGGELGAALLSEAMARPEARVVAVDAALPITETDLPKVRLRRGAWAESGVAVVVAQSDADRHLAAGARAVLLVGRARGAVLLVADGNEHAYRGEPVAVAASPAGQAVTPLLRVLHEAYGVEGGFVTVVPGSEADGRETERLLRRFPPGTLVPTATRLMEAVGAVLPTIGDRFGAMALRLTTAPVMTLVLEVLLRAAPTEEEVRALLRRQEGPAFGYSEEPLIASDVVASGISALVDGQALALKGRLLHLLVWSDHQRGYAARLLALAATMAGVQASAVR
jgi:glyceraldehyde 3-phosphate dehydrogenase